MTDLSDRFERGPMHFVFDDGTTDHDVHAVLNNPDAFVDDLAAALLPSYGSAHAGLELLIDGRPVPGGRRLDRAGLVDGTTVCLNGCSDHRAVEPARHSMTVEVIGGLDAGRIVVLSPGRWTVGRPGTALSIDDETLSADHARVDVGSDGSVTIADGGSLNGTWIANRAVALPTGVPPDTEVRLGASQITVRPTIDGDCPTPRAPDRRTNPGGTVAFNRPPRRTASTEHEPVEPPRAPTAVQGTTAVGVISVLAPLALGLAMVWLFHNWMYAMFALLSPVMLIGGAVESKRRGAKTRRRDAQRYERDLRHFADRLAALVDREQGSRHEQHPAPSEVVRRAMVRSGLLWERRPTHRDFLRLRAGLGTVPWQPPVHGERRSLEPEVREVIDAASSLPSSPVEIDLSDGRVVGIIGPRQPALSLARSLLVQAAVAHGPADLPVAVLTTAARSAAWDWTKWLPHTVDRHRSGRRLLVADPESADELFREMLERAPTGSHRQTAEPPGPPSGPTTLVVLDDESLTEGRRSPARSVLRGLAGPIAGIVVAESEDRLPAVCTTVVELLGPDGKASVHDPSTGRRISDVLIGGLSDSTARHAVRALAGLEDPELEAPGAGLPATLSLLPLLGLDPPSSAGVADLWRRSGPDPSLVAAIGVAEDGVLAVDLVRDGPHALVAGTTGAGKSELLRTLVAGLAAGCSPDHLNFVLIDYKGGSAFDRCANLPHTVGLVTDLDEALGARALRCLEAELRHRERLLRAAGAADLTEYRHAASHATLPRLVVVIDEFATLAGELPDFVEALVTVAQRGRSLGVHLVLATQRPSGAVSANIRANTNLRIALRVQDPSDSADVIDEPGAAAINRDQPGRGLARLGPGEVVAFQTALSTGIAVAGGRPPVEVRPFHFTVLDDGDDGAPSDGVSGETDLARLVDATRVASRQTGSALPRRPWPDPLPAAIDLDDLVASAHPVGSWARFGDAGAVVPFALADLPDEQAQRPTGWVPADGNLLLVGIGGSGTTTALGAIALSLAAGNEIGDLHLYVLDFGAGDLLPLADLPHTGAVITADERERQQRLVRHLSAELVRRRALTDARHSESRMVVLLDGMAGFRAAWDETDPSGVFDDLVRVFADGPDVGIHMVVAADRAGATPAAMAGLVRQRFVFRLSDTLDYGIFGIAPRDVPTLSPGGAVMAETSTHVQVGRPTPSLTEAVRRSAAVPRTAAAMARTPVPIGRLPDEVDIADVAAAADLTTHTWMLPLGIGEENLEPVGLALFSGEGAIIAGPPRSGRTSALCTVALMAHAGGSRCTVVAIADPRSTLATAPGVDLIVPPDADRHRVDAIAELDGHVLVLVDDAERVADDHGGLSALVELHRSDLHVMAAGRSESLRLRYGHWTSTLRAWRTGVLLQPDVDLDGDLLGVRLPHRSPVPLGTGRGYVVRNGVIAGVVHVARRTSSVDMKQHER